MAGSVNKVILVGNLGREPEVRHAQDGSASLVVGEALAYGRPLVVTTPMTSLLPPDYAGAVVVAPDDLDALRVGLEDAIARLDALEAAAAVDGPAFAAEQASHQAYVRELVSFGGEAPRPRAGHAVGSRW